MTLLSNANFFYLGLALTIFGFIKRNDVPTQLDVLPILDRQPIQTPTEAKPFDILKNGHRYQVTPRFDYDMVGLVVSARNFDPDIGMHARSNDALNVSDLCVVWQDLADQSVLAQFEFYSGPFYCRVSGKQPLDYAGFDWTQLSNNHLLTEQPMLGQALRNLKVGDQIRLKGMLVDYGIEGRQIRATSTTREDEGNGACESIYVTDLEVLVQSPSLYRTIMWSGLAVLMLSIGYWLWVPVKRRRKSRVARRIERASESTPEAQNDPLQDQQL
ncbi:MAG: hypothetical protein HWE20_11635 [Gammaproteobacteria bacterium]|nr:hypothetical protein [Gammaproteobacteria bacterium]